MYLYKGRKSAATKKYFNNCKCLFIILFPPMKTKTNWKIEIEGQNKIEIMQTDLNTKCSIELINENIILVNSFDMFVPRYWANWIPFFLIHLLIGLTKHSGPPFADSSLYGKLLQALFLHSAYYPICLSKTYLDNIFPISVVVVHLNLNKIYFYLTENKYFFCL